MGQGDVEDDHIIHGEVYQITNDVANGVDKDSVTEILHIDADDSLLQLEFPAEVLHKRRAKKLARNYQRVAESDAL
eukprot:7844069-Alexandrium_andersonii.AAC.1